MTDDISVTMADVEAAIRDVHDFPKPGIVFKDISPVLQNAALFRCVIEDMVARYEDQEVHAIAAIDARGFIFGSVLAYRLGCELALVRKKGKLPWKTESIAYDLEYGSNEIEIHADAVENLDRVLVVDDLLATGGTAAAAIELVRRLGGEVIGAEFLVELSFLAGRKRLEPTPVHAMITY